MADRESLTYTFNRIVGGSPCTIIGRLHSTHNGTTLSAQSQLPVCKGCKETKRGSCTRLRVSGSPDGAPVLIPTDSSGVLVTAEISVRPPRRTACQISQRIG